MDNKPSAMQKIVNGQFETVIDYSKAINTVEVAASGRLWHYFGDLISKSLSIALASQI